MSYQGLLIDQHITELEHKMLGMDHIALLLYSKLYDFAFIYLNHSSFIKNFDI